MEEPNRFQDLYGQAQQLSSAGDYPSAIDRYGQLVRELMGRGPVSNDGQPAIRDLLASAADELVSLLRWMGRYDEAIDVQERIVTQLPERAPALRLSIANLQVEGGQEEQGLQGLREIAQAQPDDVWAWITLGTAHLWLGQYEPAERRLRQALDMTEAADSERAEACRYLYAMYEVQGQVDAAVAIWEEGCRLDPMLREMLPQVVRFLISRRHWPRAMQLLEQEPSVMKKLFYQGLSFTSQGVRVAAEELWDKMLTGVDPEALTEAHDEFAEAALRLLVPRLALAVLQPLIERHEISRHRLLLAGLAWAQSRVINRAEDCLSIALRLADLERPRRSRPGGKQRILDAESRILYGNVVIDTDLRRQLDRFFMPSKT